MYNFFLNHSSVIFYNFTIAELLHARDSIESDFFEFDLIKSQPQFDYIHEQQHFRQFNYTPFGLLIWRIQNIISADINYLTNFLSDNNLLKKIYLPIGKCWKDEGKRIIKDLGVPILPLEIKNEIIKYRLHPAHSAVKNMLFIYLENLISEIDILKEFLSFLNMKEDNKNRFSIETSLILMNKAMKIVSKKMGVDYNCKIISKSKESNIGVFSEKDITAKELLEGNAKMRENLVLDTVLRKKMNSFFRGMSNEKANEILNSWLKLNIIDNKDKVYQKLYSYSEFTSKDTHLLELISFLSFCGEIDVSTNWSKEIYIEDIIPSLRFKQLINEVFLIEEKEKNLDVEKIIRKAYEKLNWKQPEELFKKISEKKLSSDFSWTGDAVRRTEQLKEKYSYVISISNYTEMIESQIRRNMMSLSMNFFDNYLLVQNKPFIEIYSNMFVFNGEYYKVLEHDIPFRGVEMFSSIIINEFMFQLYDNKIDINILEFIYSAFLGRLSEFSQQDKNTLVWEKNVKEFIKNRLGDFYYNLLINNIK